MASVSPTKLQRDGDSLVIAWSDGVNTKVDWRTLRKQCPCALCNEEREKPADPFRILSEKELVAGAPSPLKMVPKGSYAYQIIWNDGHDTGIYTIEYLRKLSTVVETKE